jgi:uncharacterized RDD family membrane protein YckC
MRRDGHEFDLDDFERDDKGRPVPSFEVAPEGAGARATIAQRAAARLLDVFLVVLLPGGALLWTFGERDGNQVRFPLWALLVSVAIAGAYEVGLVATRGATLGKQLMGIRVVRYLDGGLPTWGMSAIRFLVPSLQYTAVLLFQLLALVVYLSAAWNPERRGLHDRASGTLVVRTR